MKTLLILRHAKSSWKDDHLPDHDRPLNKRGKQDAPRMGKLLQEKGLVPDLIISSTAKRAQKTAQLVAEESGYDGEIQFDRDLYAFEAAAYLEKLAQIGDQVQIVLLVGHNPGLEELLEQFTGEYLRMPTAALAQVNLSVSSWSDIDEDTQVQLANVWRPKEL
jgi:phosphohistidine phosphatase